MSRESLRSLRSETAERSLVRLRNRSIEEENVRLHRKLESTRSTISRDRLIEGYSSNRPIRDRITTKTNKKKEELRKIMQRKFNLDPVVVLPKVRTATNSP
jgi:transposase InsO family protein